MNKKGLEMGFAWIFAILVGMAILFLAIFGATKFVDLSEKEITTKTSKALLNVLDELQTTVEGVSSDVVPLAVETKIFTSCDIEGGFGTTNIEISERIRFGEYSKKGGKVSTENAYLFADDIVEGKNAYFLTFPFELPFKVGDVVILYSKEHCFVSPPSKVKDNIDNLKGNLVTVSDISSCSTDSKTVCFNSNNCDVNVQCSGDCNTGFVSKDSERDIYFEDNLLYGLIFSSKDNYDCNVERLMKRLNSLSNLYAKKSELVSINNCNTGLRSDFILLKDKTENYQDLRNLPDISLLSKNIDNKNKELECQLY